MTVKILEMLQIENLAISGRAGHTHFAYRQSFYFNRIIFAGVTALAELQDKLYAQDKWAVLLIFQAMDAVGKDGAIKHVLSGVNPQGCQVYSFKSPSSDDLDHDYL